MALWKCRNIIWKIPLSVVNDILNLNIIHKVLFKCYKSYKKNQFELGHLRRLDKEYMLYDE